jgi:molybdate transport system permease protein
MPVDWTPLLRLSLDVAGLATAISLVLGVWLAFLLRGRRAVDAVLWLPLVFPPTIVISYFLFPFTGRVAVAAALVYTLPFLLRAARAAFQGVDRDYLNAARMLGASDTRAFVRVVLPLAWRPIISAAAIAFGRVLAEFAATLWIAGRLPVSHP